MERSEPMARILVVDDERDMLTMLHKVIAKKCGADVQVADSAEKGLLIAGSWLPDVVLTDIKMPGMDGIELLQQLMQVDPTITIVIMTGYGTIEIAVQALKAGAYDFLEKPFENEQIIHVLNRAQERTRLLRENANLHRRLVEHQQIGDFVGRSKKLTQVLDLLARIAASKSTVLIRGASGTGKELAARALHSLSQRAGKRMIIVNCPALPEQILESELFGYCKGAFTGADRDKKGLFLEANGSTILLDEIGDIPVSIQTKLLRVLQEKEIQPLGQTRTMPVDVRVLASTNQDLEAKIERGEFREDLFYRLNVLALTMPCLAEMRDDIPLLAQHFLEKYMKEHNRPGLAFAPDALQCLIRRSWPGNIRELQNTINRAVLLCNDKLVTPSDLVDDSQDTGTGASEYTQSCFLQLPYKQAKEEVVNTFTRSYLTNALLASRGNVSAAARNCGIERQAFQRLMRRYAVTSQEFRT